MHYPILKATQIVQLTTQKDINVVAGRRVRYDVYVQDEDKQHCYWDASSWPTEFALSLAVLSKQIDHGLLLPGKDYRDLSLHPTYVIMFVILIILAMVGPVMCLKAVPVVISWN